jgi:hypothetical protein
MVSPFLALLKLVFLWEVVLPVGPHDPVPSAGGAVARAVAWGVGLLALAHDVGLAPWPPAAIYACGACGALAGGEIVRVALIRTGPVGRSLRPVAFLALGVLSTAS